MKNTRKCAVLAAILVLIAACIIDDVNANKEIKPSEDNKRLLEINDFEIKINELEIASSKSIYTDLYNILLQLKKILENLLYGSTSEPTTTTLVPEILTDTTVIVTDISTNTPDITTNTPETTTITPETTTNTPETTTNTPETTTNTPETTTIPPTTTNTPETTTIPPTTTRRPTVDPANLEAVRAAAIKVIQDYEAEVAKAQVIADTFTSEVYPFLNNYYNTKRNEILNVMQSMFGVCQSLYYTAIDWIGTYTNDIYTPLYSIKYDIELIEYYGGTVNIKKLNETLYTTATMNDTCTIIGLTALVEQSTQFIHNNRIILENSVTRIQNDVFYTDSTDSDMNVLLKFIDCFCPRTDSYRSTTTVAPTTSTAPSSFIKRVARDTTTTVDPIIAINDTICSAEVLIHQLKQKRKESSSTETYIAQFKNNSLLEYDMYHDDIVNFKSNAQVGSLCYDLTDLTDRVLNRETIKVNEQLDQILKEYTENANIDQNIFDLENVISDNITLCEVQNVVDVANIMLKRVGTLQSSFSIQYDNIVRPTYGSPYKPYEPLIYLIKCVCSYGTKMTTLA